ncbi:hypothetical protein KFE25_005705 [Diacronema lutheri]|uniref:Methyltransferase FkbM domain-containing protein n=1 Tax=Diacronema lutheri TaxID=2081491 RepID=A0A8J5X8H0_DIALT|nr:hypothetical protein KFE25_005705 [Diacronema lutheri]
MAPARSALWAVGLTEFVVGLWLVLWAPMRSRQSGATCELAAAILPRFGTGGRAGGDGPRGPPALVTQPRVARLADGCEHVYLDVGSNIGVQVRKLFEPEHYPHAKVLPLFDAQFGTDRRRTVCAFGWEPNPSHTKRLREVEAAYARRGWRTTFHTETAAGVRAGSIPFFWTGSAIRDLAASALNNAHLSHVSRSEGAVEVHRTLTRTADLAAFLNEHIHARAPPPGGRLGRVVMKVDVEGYELDLLPDLLLRGALCSVDVLYAEMHPTHFRDREPADRARYTALGRFVHETFRAANGTAKRLDTSCALVVVGLDDETYRLDDGYSELKADRWMRKDAARAREQGFPMARPPLPP